MRITSYYRCNCGAITVNTDTPFSYSCKKENFEKFFPDVRLEQFQEYRTTVNCNHCVNHYGLDLCGCGSGEDFGKCSNNLPECKQPMQRLGETLLRRQR